MPQATPAKGWSWKMGDEARTIFEQEYLGRILTELRFGEGSKNVVPLRNTGQRWEGWGSWLSEGRWLFEFLCRATVFGKMSKWKCPEGSWRWGLGLRRQSYKFWSHLYPDDVWSLRSLKVFPRLWYCPGYHTFVTAGSPHEQLEVQVPLLPPTSCVALNETFYLLSLSFLTWKTEIITATSPSKRILVKHLAYCLVLSMASSLVRSLISLAPPHAAPKQAIARVPPQVQNASNSSTPSICAHLNGMWRSNLGRPI